MLLSLFFQEAIAKLDQQVCESKKRLNAMRHQCKMKEKRLTAIQTEYNQMVKDSETISLADTGESDESRVRRSIHFYKSFLNPIRTGLFRTLLGPGGGSFLPASHNLR